MRSKRSGVAIGRRPRRRRPGKKSKQYKALKMSLKDQRTFCFKRKHLYATISSNGTADVTDGFVFRLTDLPGYGEWTSLFDQYKIYKIVIELIPGASNAPSSSSSIQISQLAEAVDTTDETAPATFAAILNYENVRVHCALNGTVVRRTIYPRVAVATYAGAFTSYHSKTGWIDTASPNVEHYGWKYAFKNLDNDLVGYQMFTTFYVCCRGVQ